MRPVGASSRAAAVSLPAPHALGPFVALVLGRHVSSRGRVAVASSVPVLVAMAWPDTCPNTLARARSYLRTLNIDWFAVGTLNNRVLRYG